ncbi:MAG: ribosomal protein S19 family protein [Candidatus Woesearchaeota archaeon]
MAREFKYRGYTLEQLKQMSIEDFAKIAEARIRRKLLKRGFTHEEKKLLERVKKGKNNIKTRCRAMPILPIMVDKNFKVHNGKEYVDVKVVPEMIGHRLGEFVLTRKPVVHNVGKKTETPQQKEAKS